MDRGRIGIGTKSSRDQLYRKAAQYVHKAEKNMSLCQKEPESLINAVLAMVYVGLGIAEEIYLLRKDIRRKND